MNDPVNITHYIGQDKKQPLATAGFTLIELMIVVVIIAVLAAVAIVSYKKHLQSGRVVEARTFIATIQARQEAYFQRFGQYCDVSAGDSGDDVPFPELGNNHCVGGDSSEPCPKVWEVNGSYPITMGWRTLGARPESGHSYFEFIVRASNPSPSGSNPNHALNATATTLGIPPQPAGGVTPHPWYYLIARADLDGSGVPCSDTSCTILTTTSAQAQIVSHNEGR